MGRKKKMERKENWNEIKEKVMQRAIYAKFTQNLGLKKKLLDTHPAELI